MLRDNREKTRLKLRCTQHGVALHVGPARIEEDSRLGVDELFATSQHEAPVGLVVSIGIDGSRKQQLRGYFLATCPNYTSALTTNQSGKDNILRLQSLTKARN